MQTIDADHRRDARADWRDTQKSGRQAPNEKEMVLVSDTPIIKPRKKYNPHHDDITLRKNIEAILATAIQDVLGGRITFKARSSSITHTALQPEGDQFSINFVVEVHEKTDPP